MTSAEHGRFSLDPACPLSIISGSWHYPRHLKLSQALELCLVCRTTMRKCCCSSLLALGSASVKDIGTAREHFWSMKNNMNMKNIMKNNMKRRYRWLMHLNKNHDLALISLVCSEVLQFCNTSFPSSGWAWELEKASGFITQVIDIE